MTFCCCCLCCPIHRCAISLCILELIVSLTLWYNSLDLMAKTYEVLQLKDVIFILFISSWIITLCTSAFILILAHRKNRSEFVLPRLIQQIMLLIVGFMIAVLIVFYFSGGAASINNVIIKIYESVILGSKLSSEDRRQSKDDLRFCFLILILLDFFFICYMALGLSVTKKFYMQLKRSEYRHAPQSVERSTTSHGLSSSTNVGYKQQNTTALPLAPPPYNPNYAV